jgi:ornithine cyclodeaminase/alanine dehydrogenase-like protein (mu-crystallin family)
MRVVSAAEIDAALDPAGLVEALADAFTQEIVAPARHHHAIARPDAPATLLLMPAWTERGVVPAYLGTKLVSVFQANAACGLPSVLGTYLLMDGATGAPLAALDGARLTLWRTAAASALAARHLARTDAARLVMVGAGALAPFLIRAHAVGHALTDIALWNHKPERAQMLASELAGERLPVRAITDLESAIRQADIVSAATLSTEPLVRGAWLKPGAHLDLVGAFTPAMRESDDDCVRRASLFCDTRAGALREGGDLARPLADGVMAAEDIRADLYDLCAGRHAGRSSLDEITLFKSVGSAVEDLAAAMLVWRRIGRS